MLKTLFTLVLTASVAAGAHAQLNAIVGSGSQSGTSSNSSTGDCGPVYRSASSSSFDYSRHHYLYTQSELQNAGLVPGVAITDIAWYKTDNAQTTGGAHFEIWINNSTRTSVRSAPQSFATLTTGSNATLVYSSNSQTFNSTAGWKNFEFTSPYIYTGGALEVTVAWDISGVSGSPTTGGFSWKKDPVSNRTISYCGSSSSTTLNNNRTVRAQVRFTYDACLAPANLAASNVTTTTADLNWDPVSGANMYEYAVTASSAPPSSGTATTATNGSVSGLTLNTLYYMHVRSKCGPTSFSQWASEPFMTDDAYCKPPENVLYSNLTESSVDIIWNVMQTSDWYEYKVDLTPNAQPTSMNAIATTNHYASAGNLLPSTRYYLYLRSFCLGGNDSSAWHMDSFMTRSLCEAPNVTISNAGSATPLAYWPRVPQAVAYEYIVTNTESKPNFGNQIFDTFVVVSVSDDEAQYLHVRSKCNSQFTFSDWATIQLREATTGVHNVQSAGNMQLYPNPASSLLHIETRGMNAYRITDMRGVEVMSGSIAGDKEVIDIANLPAGIYILQATGEAGNAVTRFTRQ